MRLLKIAVQSLILCLLLVYPGAIASGQNKLSFVSVQSGLSLPFGKYSQKNLDKGCFTLPGVNISAEGAWFFTNHFGVGASTGINWHPVDVGYLGYEKVIADPFLDDVYIRSEPYKVITGMIGPFCMFPIREKLQFTGKLLGGLLWAKTPWQLYKPVYFMVEPKWYEITSANNWKYTFQIGAGLNYEITPCYSILLNSDLFYRKMAFQFETATETITNERVFSFVNTTLGIRFKL